MKLAIPSPTRRPGLSLTEVLVALFVMALGMISLLTLFPLGAVQMGRAMRDNRCAETATQADAMMRVWWQTEVVEKPGNEDPFFYAMNNPNDARTGAAAPATFATITSTPRAAADVPVLATTTTAPSYPVFVDPIGWNARTGAEKSWVAHSGTTVSVPALPAPAQVAVIPRRSTRAIYGNAPTSATLYWQIFSACSLKDDLSYDTNGIAEKSGTNVIRQGKYNWLAVVQRPNNAEQYAANLAICVFDGRPPASAPALREQINSCTMVTPTRLSMTFPVTNVPPLRSGNWIMDGTHIAGSGIRNANFYRIQSIGNFEIAANAAGNWTWEIDLQTPITDNPNVTARTIYVFAGLAEVFQRPQLTPNDFAQQTP